MPGHSVRLAVALLLFGGGAACSDGTSPAPEATPLKFIALAVAQSAPTSCGITGDSTLYCWGSELLLGTTAPDRCGLSACSKTPVRVAGAPKVAVLSGGDRGFCVLDPVGAPYCWGSIVIAGDIGHPLGSTPTLQSGGLHLSQISAGRSVICGVAVGGQGYCWGDYIGGIRGDSSVALDTFPEANFTPNLVSGGHLWSSIASSLLTTCGVSTAGALYCWGTDWFGTLGDSTAPAQSCGFGVQLPCHPAPYPIAPGLTFSALSGAEDHFCGLANGGMLYCWGDGLEDELASAALTTCLESGNPGHPCAPVPSAAWFSPLRMVSTGVAITCGADSLGVGQCWGSNDFGALGNGGGSSGPVRGGLVFQRIAAGLYHSCGLTVDSLAYCWGNNDLGALGDGTTRDANEPVAVVGPASP